MSGFQLSRQISWPMVMRVMKSKILTSSGHEISHPLVPRGLPQLSTPPQFPISVDFWGRPQGIRGRPQEIRGLAISLHRKMQEDPLQKWRTSLWQASQASQVSQTCHMLLSGKLRWHHIKFWFQLSNWFIFKLVRANYSLKTYFLGGPRPNQLSQGGWRRWWQLIGRTDYV